MSKIVNEFRVMASIDVLEDSTRELRITCNTTDQKMINELIDALIKRFYVEKK